MLKKISLLTLLFLMTQAYANPCFPPIDKNQPQYIIGYGSLLSTKSKNNTYPHTGENIPVKVSGYQRGWFARGEEPSVNTVFLGIVNNPDATFNGVIFKLPFATTILYYDKREQFNCREAVKPEQITVLINRPLPKGQYWIYPPDKKSIGKPSADYPIVQSYVDEFIAGCLEIQSKYQLKHYADQCITDTSDWSMYWVNDRIYPRRPWIYQPNAEKIDTFLKTKLPQFFSHIKIEP